MTKKLEEARKERDFLKELNGSLLRNQADLQEQLADVQAQLKCVTETKQAAINDLEEQVRRCGRSSHGLWVPAGPWHRMSPLPPPYNASGSDYMRACAGARPHGVHRGWAHRGQQRRPARCTGVACASA